MAYHRLSSESIPVASIHSHRATTSTLPILASTLCFTAGIILSPVFSRVLGNVLVLEARHRETVLFPTDFAPAASAVDYEEVQFTGSPSFDANGTMYIPDQGRSIYAGEPSTDIDAAWDELLFGRYFSVTAEEAGAALGSDYQSYYSPIASSYIIGLDVFHTLHCVNQLRKAFAPEHYGPMAPLHRQHCLEQVRQYVMCAGDTTPVPTKYYPALKEPNVAGEVKGGDYVASDVVHTCRNFGKLRAWLTERYSQSSVKWDT